MQEKRRRPRRKLPAWLEITILGVLALLLFTVGWGVIWATFMPLPAINNFENRKVAESTKIFDRTGNVVLYDVHGTMRRTAVPLDKIATSTQLATIAIEDATFYQNKGFRPLSFARALIADVFSGSYAQGGSTITQQVVKNALLTQDKTIARKIEEIILALRLGKAYTKDQILQTYLNETSYGGTIYGVQEAAQYFFAVDAKDLDLAQSAYLAALPQAPTHLSPYGSHKNELEARQKLVLQKMLDNNFISQKEYNAAIAEKVTFSDETEAGIKAPHFVFYVREYLEEKYGVDAVNSGGLRVITTLDYDLQKEAEGIVASDTPTMQKQFNASNAGVVAIDPKTGQVLAMVGSRGYFDPDIDGKVNVTLANRQPGSSFKPFVYATAFERGYTPDTVVFDVQTQFSTACPPTDVASDSPPCYSPSNFDGSFKGPMTLRNAIAQSENVPSVKTLYLAGIQNSIDTAVSMGISTLADAAQYGLTLVLGGGEVNLLEMTGAYGVFANDGIRNPPTGILRVEDGSGNILESYQDQSTRVLDPQIARQIDDILSDDNARSPEFGVHGVLYFNGADVADKTGTTNDFRDVWVLGYTPSVVVGAWAGNNDNKPMQKKIAAFIIAPMWHKIMAYAIQKYPADSFPQPAPDPDMGTLPPVLTGNWNTDPSLGVHDILYWIDKNNPRAGRPADPTQDPQFQYWDYPVQLWVQGGGAAGAYIPQTPSQPQTPQQLPTSLPSGFHVLSPTSGAVFPLGTPITFAAYSSGMRPAASVLYYVNGLLVGQSVSAPYNVAFKSASPGNFTVRAVAIHPDGTSEEESVPFIVQ